MNTQPNIKPNPTKQLHDQQDDQETFDDKPEEIQAPRIQSLKPDFQTCKNYKDRALVIKQFPHLATLDDAEKTDFEALEDAYAYIIRSNNDDDIHKAIKYGVWSSTPPNNEMLNEVFDKANKENKQVFLFYSVVKSGQFVGVARLASNKFDETFDLWWQHSKWRGHFKIEWLFIKDITYKFFENLLNAKNDPVIRSKDGTQVDWKETGQKMMKIFKEAPVNQSIFNDFEHMDQRESYLRYMRNFNQQQQQYLMSGPQQYQNYYQQQIPQQFNNYYPMQMMMHPQNMYFQQQQRFMNAYPPQNYQQGGHNNSHQGNNNNNNNNNHGNHNYNYGGNNHQNGQGNGQRYYPRGQNNHSHKNNYHNNYQYQKKDPKQE